jgi:hypothetical protein
MLIDDVLAHRSFGATLDKFPMLSDLRAAHAFVLAADAQEAASHLMKSAATPATITGQFRLPYPMVWIEAAIDGAKIGFYLDGRNNDGLMFCLCFVRAPGQFGIKSAGMFEPDTIGFIDGGKMREFTLRCQPMQAMLDKSPDAHGALISAVITVMSAVAIINSPAVSAIDPADIIKLNRQRTRRGKQPLVDYHTVHIRPEVARQIRAATSNGQECDGVRLHWRRGHFKARKTGLFWWSPHLAGQKELGMVEKDYVA